MLLDQKPLPLQPRIRCFRRRAPQQSGLTFIELLLTLIILLVGMLACLEFVTIAIASAVNAQKLVVAKDLCQDTLEQVFTMRDNNAIGGLPAQDNRNSSTFVKLDNEPTGIFKGTFQPIAIDIGADQIRGTTDDNYTQVDPRFTEYTLRILVNPAIEMNNTVNKNMKRITVEVEYPFLRTRQRTKAKVESYIGAPPRVGA